jgi:ABC-type transport system involved in cytochrome c biogenesis ATPase subunit
MLKRLEIHNFTVFGKASFDFSPGLNMVVGTNGTGKTQLLKLGYLFLRAWPELAQSKQHPSQKRRPALASCAAGDGRGERRGLAITQGSLRVSA